MRYLPYGIVGSFILVGILAVIFIPSLLTPQVACTEEALVCPDGSSVGRTGPQCKFSACPSMSPYVPVVLSKGSLGTSKTKLERIATSDSTLKTLFKSLSSPEVIGTFPSLDWTKEVVVGVSMGSRATGGYDVSFEKYDTDPITGAYRFYVTETRPGANCVSTESITYPYEIVKFQVAGTEVASKGYQFVYKETVLDCVQ